MFSWRQLGRETLWGRRGLIKISTLWLPLGALLLLDAEGRAGSPAGVALALFIASAGLRTAGALANDLVDRADDRAAGKARWSASLSTGFGALIIALLAIASIAIVSSAGAPPAAVVSFSAAFALGIVYSTPPLRAKDRGVLGPLVFAACCVLHYVVTLAVWFGPGWRLPLALGTAMFLEKWVNLHFHQIVDYGADVAGGRPTFVAKLGLKRARRGLRTADALAVATAAVALAMLALDIPTLRWAIIAAATVTTLGAIGYARRARRSAAPTALVRELSGAYLGISYALFRITPVLLLGRLALQQPAMIGIFAIYVLLFALESVYALRYRYE